MPIFLISNPRCPHSFIHSFIRVRRSNQSRDRKGAGEKDARARAEVEFSFFSFLAVAAQAFRLEQRQDVRLEARRLCGWVGWLRLPSCVEGIEAK